MIDATSRKRLAAVGALVTVLLVTILLVTGCVPEDPEPSPSRSQSPTASRTPSPSPSATPDETSDAEPSPEPTVFPSPQTPSEGTASDGWTYAQLAGLCQDWVLTRTEQNANEEWNFDAGYPAQRYGGVWDIGFDGTFTLPGETTPTEGFIACAISGTPDDFAVGLSETSGDAPADEVLRP